VQGIYRVIQKIFKSKQAAEGTPSCLFKWCSITILSNRKISKKDATNNENRAHANCKKKS
jgi:hypothetical protein